MTGIFVDDLNDYTHPHSHTHARTLLSVLSVLKETLLPVSTLRCSLSLLLVYPKPADFNGMCLHPIQVASTCIFNTLLCQQNTTLDIRGACER